MLTFTSKRLKVPLVHTVSSISEAAKISSSTQVGWGGFGEFIMLRPHMYVLLGLVQRALVNHSCGHQCCTFLLMNVPGSLQLVFADWAFAHPSKSRDVTPVRRGNRNEQQTRESWVKSGINWRIPRYFQPMRLVPCRIIYKLLWCKASRSSPS